MMRRDGKMAQKHCKYCGESISSWKIYCNLLCRNKGYIGIKHTDEHRKHISEALKGTRPKNMFQSGDRHPFWNPDRTDMRERLTGKYRDWRFAVIKRDKYTCQECGAKRGNGNVLHVDHIKPFSLFPELRYEVNNGRVLCMECHRKTDSYCRKRYAKFVGKEQEWVEITLPIYVNQA
jgi:hypothetical protein